MAYPLQGRRYNWSYLTDPEPHMNNRRMECGRGKVWGGSSLINGMCYIPWQCDGLRTVVNFKRFGKLELCRLLAVTIEKQKVGDIWRQRLSR